NPGGGFGAVSSGLADTAAVSSPARAAPTRRRGVMGCGSGGGERLAGTRLRVGVNLLRGPAAGNEKARRPRRQHGAGGRAEIDSIRVAQARCLCHQVQPWISAIAKYSRARAFQPLSSGMTATALVSAARA